MGVGDRSSAGARGHSLQELLSARSTGVLDAVADSLLLRTDISGLDQLHEVSAGVPRELTALPDRVTGRYLPGQRALVIEVDSGGDERFGLAVLDLDSPDLPVRSRDELRWLTSDPRSVHRLAGVSRDGRRIAYVSNSRNGVDFDVHVLDLETGSGSCLYDGGGWCMPASGFSPDGRWLSVLRPGPRPLDTDLLLLDVETGAVQVVLPHPQEAAEVRAPAWVDATTFLVSSNVARDLRAVMRCDVLSGTCETVLEGPWDLDVWTSRDGSQALVVANVDGSSEPELHDARTLRHSEPLPLPSPDAVIVSPPALPDPFFAPDGKSVLMTVSSPRAPAEAWRYGVTDGVLSRITRSPRAPMAGLVVPERHTVASFDGVRVPLFLYRPAPSAAPPPVVVVVHGGPEGQSTTAWSPVVQGLVARGYAVVVPNVRGSTGYGKRYAALDDTTRRLDSVADLAAVHAWLPGAGLDPARAALWGGSYGGYMVLAGCAFQPSLWAAGVDIVGISDLVTFLENTADYRRAHREREYGSLSRDREFLAAASPLRRVSEIQAPLFVVHGANDPRVPLSEAEQLVASLRERGVPCELLVYGDEGHGLAKLANRLDAYPRAMDFLDAVLQPGRSPS